MNTPSTQLTPRQRTLLSLGAAIVGLALLFVFEGMFDVFTMQIFKLCAINVILALSLNLINGFTGLFSLGHAGFMAVGAYTCAILTMSPDQKEANYVLQPIVPWLANVQIPFVPALLLGGVIAGFIGWLLGVVALVREDDEAGGVVGFILDVGAEDVEAIDLACKAGGDCTPRLVLDL